MEGRARAKKTITKNTLSFDPVFSVFVLVDGEAESKQEEGSGQKSAILHRIVPKRRVPCDATRD